MKIEQVTKSDRKLVEQIARLHQKELADSVLSRLGTTFLKVVYNFLISDRSNILLVLREGGAVAGYALAMTTNYPLKMWLTGQKTMAELQFIAVGRKWQGKGWGTKLVAKLDQVLAGRGIREYIVGTKAANRLSNNFYKKLGFKFLETKQLLGQRFNYYLRAQRRG